MSKNNGIFIPCEEAGHICDKNQYKEASFWQRVKLIIHLIYCSVCRKYSKNNLKLTKLSSKPEVECLTSNEKDAMKETFSKALQEHTD